MALFINDQVILARLGTPAGASIAADIAAIASSEAAIGTPVNTGGTATISAILGDAANTSVVSRLGTINTNVGTPTNTGGTASLAAILGNPSNTSHSSRLATIQTMTDKIGTVTNTGGTASLGAILGDAANSDIVTRLASTYSRIGAPAGASIAADLVTINNGVVSTLGAANTASSQSSAANASIGTPVNTGGTADLASILGDPSNVSHSASLSTLKTNVGTPANTGGTASLAAILGNPSNTSHSASLSTLTTNIGTPTNTGGTASIGAILGDFANKTLVARLGSVVDGAITTIAAALGTGDQAAGTAGTAAESLHQKVRKALALIGTITNTGGTATIGAILGDFANTTLTAVLGAPGTNNSIWGSVRGVGNGFVIEEGTLDGGFTHTTTVIQCSTLDGSVDYYSGMKCTVIKNVGAAGRPRRTTGTVLSYDTANKRITLVAALPWTPVNGDGFVVIPP